MQPTFITGANAKIKIAGKIVAFCTDVSYQINVKHVSTQILGGYEPSSIEPVSYNVSGAFSIIRYVDGIKSESDVPNLAEKGNGIGNMGEDGGYNKVKDSFNPIKLQNAGYFDLEIYQKTKNNGLLAVSRLRECRLISSSSYLTKKNVMQQVFQFIAKYADEDTFTAEVSSSHLSEQ